MAEDRFRALELLVSELVTNSVRHAQLGPGEQFAVRVNARGDRVAVMVEDPGPGFRPPADPSPGSTSGWGLYLVDRLADRWGVEVDRATRVWFELPRV